MDTLLKFVLEHENDDVSTLLLGASKWPGIDMHLAAECILSRRKLKEKLPQWYANGEIYCPKSLSAEQCSSESTAAFKASLLKTVFPHSYGSVRLADLTGGLGADSYQFSLIASRVLYNEMDQVLARAAEHNFPLLGADNISISSVCVQPGKLALVLDGFAADIIYLDPARRSSSGRKLFFLEDCSPDVQALKGELFSFAPHILLKLSPMADISLICRQLGPQCREVWVVESAGECKELLLWMDKDWRGSYKITAVRDGARFSFTPLEESQAVPVFADKPENARYLFEPCKAIMKAGAYNLMCSRQNLEKLASSTHLYLCDEPSSELFSSGKVFRVLRVLPFNRQSIKEIAEVYPSQDVTARNLHITSDALKKKLGKCTSHSLYHIFAASCGRNGDYIFVTERVLSND